jgi:hypothetical protein
MSRASLRAVVVTSAVLLSFAGGVEVARACNEPYLEASPSDVRPGDTVTWALGNVEARAHYTVTLAGRPLAQGEAGASAPTGTFVMPDFGSKPRDVPLELGVTHTESSPTHPDGGFSRPTADSDTLNYRLPPPPAAPQSPPASAPGTPAPADGLGAAPPKDRQRTQKGATGGRRDPGPPTRPPAAREPAPQNPAPTRPAVPVPDTQVPDTAAAPAHVEPRATGRSTVNARDRSAVTTTDRSAATARDRNAVKSRALRTEAVQPKTLPVPEPSRRLPFVQPPVKAIRPLEDGDAIPGIALVGLSVLLVLGLGAVAIWALHPRGSPPASRLAANGPQWIPPGLGLEARSRDLVIEAELQELIAEERARQVAREAAAIRTGPG